MSESSSVDRLIVDGAKLDANIAGRVISMTTSESMELAATLDIVIDDSDGLFQRSGVLSRTGKAPKRTQIASPWARLGKVQIELDTVRYRLVGVQRVQENDGRVTVTLQCEDESSVVLRSHTRKRVFSRGSITRVGVARALILGVQNPRIPYIVANPTAKRPVDTAGTRREQTEARSPGFAKHAVIEVKGVRATAKQRDIIDGVLTKAQQLGASRRVMIAAVMAITTESLAGKLMDTLTGNDDVGIYQQGRNWIDVAGSKDPARSTEAFLVTGPTSWKVVHGSIRNGRGDLGKMIADVQKPRDASGGGYRPWEAEATRTVDAWGGRDSSAFDQQETADQREAFEFDTEGDDWWTALANLAEPVNLRVFTTQNVVVVAFDDDLIGAKSLFMLRQDDPALLSVDYEWHLSKTAAQVDLSIVSERWQIPVGTVVEVHEEFGPIAGRWLVNQVDRDYFNPVTQVTLKRRSPAKPEPDTTYKTRRVATVDAAGTADLTSVEPKGAYAGTQAVFTQFITPFMQRQGLSPGNNPKRTPAENAAVGGSATSDHLTTNTRAYATDYPTFNGERAARELAKALGNRNWVPNNDPLTYTRWKISAGGKAFEVQIIWGVKVKHGDHVHVGVRAL